MFVSFLCFPPFFVRAKKVCKPCACERGEVEDEQRRKKSGQGNAQAGHRHLFRHDDDHEEEQEEEEEDDHGEDDDDDYEW